MGGHVGQPNQRRDQEESLCCCCCCRWCWCQAGASGRMLAIITLLQRGSSEREQERERERQTEQGSRSRLAAHVSSVSCRRRRSSPPLLLSNSSSLIGGRRLSPSLAPSLSHSCFARKPVPCLGFRHTCSLRTASALDTITESAADKRDTRSSQQEPGRGPRDDRGSVYGPLDGGRRQDSRRREAHLWSSSSSRVDDK